MKYYTKENSFEGLLYLLILTIPFFKGIPNIILIILALFFIVDLIRGRKISHLFLDEVFFFSVVGFLVIKALLNNTYLIDQKIYNGYLLAISGLIIFKKANNLPRLKQMVLLSVNLTAIASLVLISEYYFKKGFLPFEVTTDVNRALILERPYQGFYALIGVLICFELSKKAKKYKIALLLNAAFLIGFIVLISARLSLLSLFFIASVFFVFYYQSRFIVKATVLSALIGALLLIVLLNKNTANRFFIKKTYSESIEVASDYEPRLIIWDCAFEMSRQPDFNKLIGSVSYQTIQNHFLNCYDSKIEKPGKKEYYLAEKFNAHNQFIDFYLIGGFLGLSLFVIYFLKNFLLVKSNFTKTSFLLALLFFLIVENVLYRQFGCYLFGLLIVLIKAKEENNIKKIRQSL
ncbi:MAG: O-antigen ligase family protein [Bacteroidetes bacterium]|nr:O-antigen ligase family protein [Bacteroidota bacterium]